MPLPTLEGSNPNSPAVEDPGFGTQRHPAPRRGARIRNMASTYISSFAHVIFATQHRAPMIAESWRQDLHRYLGGAVVGLGAKPIAVGGVADHVHLLVSLRATHCLADLVREIKKSSSNWASERYAGFGWQTGYAAFSLGASELARVTQYVATQEEHHRKLTSAEELRLLLAEHQVPIDERFFE